MVGVWVKQIPPPKLCFKGFNHKNESYHKTPHKLHRNQKDTFQNGAFRMVQTQNKHLRATGIMKYDTNPNFMHYFLRANPSTILLKKNSCCLFHLFSWVAWHLMTYFRVATSKPQAKGHRSNPRRDPSFSWSKCKPVTWMSQEGLIFMVNVGKYTIHGWYG